MVIDVCDVDVGTLLVDVCYVIDDLGAFTGLISLLPCRLLLLMLTGMLFVVVIGRGCDLGLRVSVSVVSLSVDIHVRYHCLSSTICCRSSLIGVVIRLVGLHVDLVAFARSCRT